MTSAFVFALPTVGLAVICALLARRNHVLQSEDPTAVSREVRKLRRERTRHVDEILVLTADNEQLRGQLDQTRQVVADLVAELEFTAATARQARELAEQLPGAVS